MDRDVRFTQKKVDEGWKDQIERDRHAAEQKSAGPKASPETSEPFFNLLNSLAIQALIHLGEMPHAETQQPEPNLSAARETIDILAALKAKTQGNLSPKEAAIFDNVLPELQLKFTRQV